MDRNNLIAFNNEKDMFATVFRFCIKYIGKRLVIVEDDVIRKEMIEYLSSIGAFVDENKDINGFCIYKCISQNINNYSCMAEICTPNTKTYSLCIELPNMKAVFDPTMDEGDNYWKFDIDAGKSMEYPRVQCFLMNKELKPLFLNTFTIAENEIDIICPWVNRLVVNEKFIELLRSAVSRGVTVKITYGIGADDDSRQKTSVETVELLKKLFADNENLKIKKGNTHIKCLICDDKYMMCGSYNILSFTADYTDKNERDEGMNYIVDKNQIEITRRRLF